MRGKYLILDLLHVYFKEIIVLEEVIEARYASYRNELHEFARKPVCYSSGCEYSTEWPYRGACLWGWARKARMSFRH